MMLPALLTGFWADAARWTAQLPPPTICGNLPGCTPTTAPVNVLATNIIPRVAGFTLNIAAGLSILMIVWYGVRLIMTGEDGRSKAKLGIFYSMLGLFVALMASRIVSSIATEQYGQGNTSDFIFGGLFASAVRILLTASNVMLLSIIIYQGMRMVMAQGKSDEFNTARYTIFWAVMGAIVINVAQIAVNFVLTLPL